jgi:hypothetical protein
MSPLFYFDKDVFLDALFLTLKHRTLRIRPDDLETNLMNPLCLSCDAVASYFSSDIVDRELDTLL